MTRTLFGFPLYIGMKRRVAKKYFNRYWMSRSDKQQYSAYLKQFEHTKIGDSVNTCSGLNGKITGMTPEYILVGGGQLLLDIVLCTTVGNCSFTHCGIEPPKTKAEMEAAIKEYLQHPQAKLWGWDIRYSPEVTTIHDDGTVVINYGR